MSLPLLIGIGLSAVLFIAVTLLLLWGGFFDDSGGFYAGFTAVCNLLAYTIFWAIPTLIGWAVYATWFRGAA